MTQNVTVEVMVEKILLNGADYVLFAARHEDGRYVRIRSYKIFNPLPGEMYRVAGRVFYRPDSEGRKWRQIDTHDIERICMSGALIGPWLERLPHVGEVRARRLLEAFPRRLAEVLEDAQYLQEVAAALDPFKPVLSNKIAAKIYSALAARNATHPSISEELGFYSKLEATGITDVDAARALWRLVGGAGAYARLQRNPYLAASLMSWTKADLLGRSLLKESVDERSIHKHPSRLIGAIDNVWRDILAGGDTAALPEAFKQALERKGVKVDVAIPLAIKRHHIVVSGGLYRSPGAAYLEDDLARILLALERAKPGINTENLVELVTIISTAEAKSGLKLTDEQRGAVQMLLALPVGVLQGGAGVGKTTVMKVLVESWERLGGNVLMGALAGKAALQLMRGTSTVETPRLAYTIARVIRMLEKTKAQPVVTGENWSENPLVRDGPQDAEVRVDSRTLLILDEASMIDTASLRMLLLHLPTGARVLLVGDCGQLPPVGIGKVFHDMVADGTRVVTLTKVLRQASDSPVPIAAAQIREGKLPELKPWDGKSNGIFVVHDLSKLHALYEEVTSLSQDVMVVAARRKTVGAFNKKAASVRRGKLGLETHTIRLGPLASVSVVDPVVCTRNRYKDGLFNGLLGKVADVQGDTVYVHWDGEKEPREVTPEMGADIELAYAITCHRAQGSAAEIVVVCVEDVDLVTREWLYTAVTRTRKTVILVGSESALEAAISRRSRRLTGFEQSWDALDAGNRSKLLPSVIQQSRHVSSITVNHGLTEKRPLN